MNSLEKVKASSAWDKTYDLPTVPGLNNPFIYLALMTKLARHDSRNYLFPGTFNYINACCVLPGLYHRRPDGSGGVTSQDELIGVSYLRPMSAYWINDHLSETHGAYNNLDPNDRSLRYNLYRFPWFLAYIRSMGTGKCSFFLKLCYALHVILDARADGHPDGNLMVWLMNEEMSKYWLCEKAIKYWVNTIRQKGKKLSTLFQEHLPDHPIFAELAANQEL